LKRCIFLNFFKGLIRNIKLTDYQIKR